MDDKDRLELLVQVATWYYEENQDQSVIAKRINRSRSMVSRLLQEAREQGLVEIRVRHPLGTVPELENQLAQTFGLSRAWVLTDPPNDYTLLLRRLGRLGARCLQQKLHGGIKVGIGWGASLYQLVRAMPEAPLDQAMVVQIMGAIGHGDPMVDGSELARWLAQKLVADHRFLLAPLIVENETIAQSLFQERTVTETLSLARQVQVTLVGIGTIDSSLSGLYRTGYFNEADIASFKKAGVVGDLIGRLIDANGNPVNLPLNRSVIGQDLETLGTIPTVIGIAGGVIKAPAILAVLRGGYLDVLITDAVTAIKVLDLHPKK
jgi:DNA-binding transcriptional regulator LsrR (DeoR family)